MEDTTRTEASTRFEFTRYRSELELPLIAGLIEKELSEPYIIYTYRYFLNQWPQLCWLAWRTRSPEETAPHPPRKEPVGVVVCKLDRHLKGERNLRGYIAMLSVHPEWRGKGIGESVYGA